MDILYLRTILEKYGTVRHKVLDPLVQPFKTVAVRLHLDVVWAYSYPASSEIFMIAYLKPKVQSCLES